MIVIHHETQKLQRKVLSMKQQLDNLQAKLDRTLALNGGFMKLLEEYDTDAETLKKNILLMEYMRSMIEGHVEEDKLKDIVPERVEYARTVINEFMVYLDKKPVSERKKIEKRRFNQGVAAGKQHILQEQANECLWSAHKIFARYGCMYVLKNTFNLKDKKMKRRPISSSWLWS